MSSFSTMDTLRLPTTVCVLLALLSCVLTNFVHSASLDLPTDIQARGLNTDLEDGSVNSEAWQMLKAAELKRELVILDEAESRVLGQLQSLLAEKAQIVEKKRGHRQCLVNLVACYKKRK